MATIETSSWEEFTRILDERLGGADEDGKVLGRVEKFYVNVNVEVEAKWHKYWECVSVGTRADYDDIFKYKRGDECEMKDGFDKNTRKQEIWDEIVARIKDHYGIVQIYDACIY
jgi:hypothetical protein